MDLYKTIKNYFTAFTKPHYILAGIAGGTIGFTAGSLYTFVTEGMPKIVRESYYGLIYISKNFPHIDLYECYQTAVQTITPIIYNSAKEGVKGFIKFGVGTILAVKFLKNRILKFFGGGEK